MAAPNSHPVSLPSIHEMFPHHFFKPEDNRAHQFSDLSSSGSILDQICFDHQHIDGHCQHCRSMSTRSHCSQPPPQSGVLPQTHAYLHDPRRLEVLRDTDSRPHATSHIHSFDVLRSDPRNESLQHLASSSSHTTDPRQHLGLPSTSSTLRRSVPPTTANGALHDRISTEGRSRTPRTAPTPAIPAVISFPSTSGSSMTNHSTSEDASDDDNPGETAGKKHICPTCLKRFNRPSSLRIHVNTHTGATPFRCPWTNCGREFNVNSNMRRHLRNHTTPGFSRPQPNDSRRKRRRVDGPMPAVNELYRRSYSANLVPSPPISHLSASDDSEYDSDAEAQSYSVRECNRTEVPPPRSTSNLTQSMAKVSVRSAKTQYGFSPYGATSRYHLYGDSPRARPLTPGSSLRSSSSSNSPSPPLPPASIPAAHTAHHYLDTTKRYSPSAAYVHSLADTRVSTALRPAFSS